MSGTISAFYHDNRPSADGVAPFGDRRRQNPESGLEVRAMSDLEDIEESTERRPAMLNEQTGSDPPKIVIAEDDEEMALLLVRAFERAGYDVNSCHNGWDLLEILGVFPATDAYKYIDLVISDIRLPGISGLNALRICGYVGKFPPVILMTAFGDNWTRVEAEKLGAVELLDKPFDIDELVEKVQRLVPPPS
jgi:CheY-like chemotaxis protein